MLHFPSFSLPRNQTCEFEPLLTPDDGLCYGFNFESVHETYKASDYVSAVKTSLGLPDESKEVRMTNAQSTLNSMQVYLDNRYLRDGTAFSRKAVVKVSAPWNPADLSDQGRLVFKGAGQSMDLLLLPSKFATSDDFGDLSVESR